MNQVFPGVFRIGSRLATKSVAPGIRVYGEELSKIDGAEYRIWDLHRSKLAAAIEKGLKQLPITPGSSVLYLGAASGTTPSHVSDIVGGEGIVFCVEFSPRPMRDLVKVCERRENMIPILADARFPEKYAQAIEEESGGRVDVIYQDVADPEQARIMQVNSKQFLSTGGRGLLALKARSINALDEPKKVFLENKKILEEHFEILQEIDLTPYDKDHLFLHLKKR